jgi:hypothetical protein
MLRVSGALSVGYGFSYPLQDLQGASWGNHEAALVFEFDQLRSIPDVEIPAEEFDPFMPEMPRVEVAPQYFITADAEKLNILEKKLVREFDADLNPETIGKLTAFDIGVLDSAFSESFFPFELEKQYFYDQTPGDSLKYSPEYQAALDSLRRDLTANPAKVFLVTPHKQEQRAAELGQFFSQSDSNAALDVTVNRPLFKSAEDSLRLMQPVTLEDLLKKDAIAFFHPAQIAFTVYPVLPEKLNSRWALVIENEDNQAVFRREGDFPGENTISWDWRNAQGELLAPGYYRYYVAWRDEWGQERHSAARTLYVRKLQRNIRIKITRNYQSADGAIDKIGIILSK